MATNYKSLPGLEYPDCTAFRIEAWTYPLYESKEKEAKHKFLEFEKIKDMIQDAAIFSAAADGQGYDYDKPELAIALIESNRTREEVEEAIGAERFASADSLRSVIALRWFE